MNLCLLMQGTKSLTFTMLYCYAAARIVMCTRKFDHITPVLEELHWLPVRYRIMYKILLLVFKSLNREAPEYITNLLHCKTQSRMLRSSSQQLLATPTARLKTYGDRAFSVAAPKLWNTLPLELRLSDSGDIFKKRLKIHLFKMAFNL